MIGEVLGSYRIVSELGKGGMGMVYRAEHVQLRRPAAIKMLLPQFSGDAEIVQRFFNEARAASAIDHPGIVEIYDFGAHTDGRAYIVMALLNGENLGRRLRRGPLPFEDGATIVTQAVAALAAAHARGIIHRDLKPDNLFLIANDLMPGGIQVKLLDFGIAKLGDDQAAGFKTQAGVLMGTPAYMSPEQCMGSADLDHRTDIYAMGCILFHVFCGRPPFASNQGTGMMIAAHIRDAAPDPRSVQPHLPQALAAIVLRCLEKEPAARYQTASELRNALVAAGANAPPSRPPGDEQHTATLAPPRVSAGIPAGVHAATAATPTARGHALATATARGHAPAATTTQRGSAAQIIGSPRKAAGASRPRTVLVAGGLLMALGGVGAAVALTRGGHDDRAGAIAGTTPPPAGEHDASVLPPPPSSGGGPRDAAPPAPPAGSAAPASSPPPEALCPPGQTRGDDTHGHCCWPGQAWSSSAGKCVGAPTCPDGMIARRASCVAPTDRLATSPSVPPRPASSPAPSFHLNATSYAPGDTIEIRFAAPIGSQPQRRAWLAVAEANSPASAYATWNYLDDGATIATLRAPSQPGAYQVRLHTDYPARTFNVQHAVSLTVKDEHVEAKPAEHAEAKPAEPEPAADATPRSAQRFTVATTKLPPGATIEVTFATALRALPNEQFWLTVVEAGAADTSWGAYGYVPAGARHMQLAAPAKPGDYEVRLHANYPTKSANVVHRVVLRVGD